MRDTIEGDNAPAHLPHSVEAEQALLGAILLSGDALDRVAGFLESQHFYDPLHARIYEAVRATTAAGRLADIRTLAPQFSAEMPLTDTLTVPQYLGRLAANATTIVNAREYGRAIYDLAKRRELYALGQQMMAAALDASEATPDALIERTEAALYRIAEKGSGERSTVTLAEAGSAVIEMANAAYQRGGGLAGLSTGFSALDDLLGGMEPGTFIVLGGRPSMGKSALAFAIGYNVAAAGVPVGVYSLEMTNQQVAMRFVGRDAGVDVADIRKGTFAAADMAKLIKANQRFNSIPMYIEDTGGLSLARLVTRARRLKRQKNIGLLIVDHMHLMAEVKGADRFASLTAISAGLKALAKELGLPIIVLSQLNRNLESRDDKRPQLSDLRESGSIEQDADVVLFVHREEYYLERQQPGPDDARYAEWSARYRASRGRAEVIQAKHRNGIVGRAELSFDAKTVSFSDLDIGGRP